MKKIFLGKRKGIFSIIDDEDFNLVSSFKWHLGSDGYARREYRSDDGGKHDLKLHRFILGKIPVGLIVDHANGNKLDNRRDNLRVCTHQQNIQNQKIRSDNKSGMKGVWWSKVAKKWTSQINLNGKKVHLGNFSDKNDAAKAYADAARSNYGEFSPV